MNLFIFLLFGLISISYIYTVSSTIFSCPNSSPCVNCNSSCSDYYCVNIEEGSFEPSDGDRVELAAVGLDGVSFSGSTLQYRINFHNNTMDYPTYEEYDVCVKYLCSWTYCPCIEYQYQNESIGLNQNKLMGMTRGLVPVMTESCYVTWRRSLPSQGEPANMIMLYGYGWYNSSTPPWEYPIQNPTMGFIHTEHEYIVEIVKKETSCEYLLYDVNGFLLLTNVSTPQAPGGNTDGINLNLYFGGQEPASQNVTVSYSKDLCCGSNNCPFSNELNNIINIVNSNE